MINKDASTEDTGEAVAHLPDPAPRPSGRSFTAAYKAATVAEYEAAPHGEKSAVLRREGLYHSHIKEWARAHDAGATAGLGGERSPGRRPHRAGKPGETEQLRAANQRLTAQLAQTRTALDIMGKAHVLLEMLSESTDTSTRSRRS